jgi:hypothetical protein
MVRAMAMARRAVDCAYRAEPVPEPPPPLVDDFTIELMRSGIGNSKLLR